MEQKLVKVSKFLSLVLRHKPETIGLELDSQGWADIDELLRLAGLNGREISRSQLIECVAQNDKQRFAISIDGSRIRANQGHSIQQVDLGLECKPPPDQLFHGTVEAFLDSIRANGLKKMSRQHVHLSVDEATALKVGSRRGKPIVLIVDSGRMHEKGFDFYLSANGVWLTDHVPAEFLRIP